MMELIYSSTAAFLAHFRVLSNAAGRGGDNYPLSAREHATLDAMHHLMEALTPEERATVLADIASKERESGEERRRYERAQLRLRRLLLANGVVR
jgi:hypothetical protein